MVKELREQVETLLRMTERIDDRTERIDSRTEGYSKEWSTHTEKIADAIENASRRQFWLSAFGLALIAGIAYMLITSVYDSRLKVHSGDKIIEMGGK